MFPYVFREQRVIDSIFQQKISFFSGISSPIAHHDLVAKLPPRRGNSIGTSRKVWDTSRSATMAGTGGMALVGNIGILEVYRVENQSMIQTEVLDRAGITSGVANTACCGYSVATW